MNALAYAHAWWCAATARRKAARKAKAYAAGWDWAAGELLRGVTPTVIADQLYPPFDSGCPHDFDHGADAALAAWAALQPVGCSD